MDVAIIRTSLYRPLLARLLVAFYIKKDTVLYWNSFHPLSTRLLQCLVAKNFELVKYSSYLEEKCVKQNKSLKQYLFSDEEKSFNNCDENHSLQVNFKLKLFLMTKLKSEQTGCGYLTIGNNTNQFQLLHPMELSDGIESLYREIFLSGN